MLAETNSPSMSPSSSANLPTPTLTKSSGNNGSVPSGVAIEFTCSAPAGYSCETVLSGTKTVSLGAKSLATDSRGQTPSVSWMWTSEKGSWSVVAKVSDSKGNVKQSPAQNLEVK